MNRMLVSLVSLCIAAPAYADVTLRCDAKTRCDGFLKNCVAEQFVFSVNIDPSTGTVTIGSNRFKADFSNPAQVTFPFTKYSVTINRYEYSAILASESEVRYGSCTKVDPAW